MVLKQLSSLALLLTATACMQDPSQVVLNGQKVFDRNSYAQILADVSPAAGGSQVNTATQTDAPATSVGVHDLAAPTKTAATTPAPKEPPHTIIAAQPVNQWTGTPHETKALPPEPKEASADAAITKPVTKISTSLMWPVASKNIVSEFGPKGSGIANDGIDIAAHEGDPVWAAADGEVVYVGSQLKDYGNMAIIKHSGGKNTTYAHLSSINVDKYDRVKQGDIIGYVGHTGDVKSPQLHFAVRDGNDPVNPMKFLDRNVASAE